ncbi:unnamed protein product [Euphydryas editha]|uniref:DUF4371 domain-containing protein n=1 Tax=Euphydryas editha TaxID=104508 RepID=A0AAU9UQC8_EUPED|nr:unnamed protein product [Euphydryas editha]
MRDPHLNDGTKRTAAAELMIHKRRAGKFYKKVKEIQEKCASDETVLRLPFDYMQNLPLPTLPVQEIFYYRQLWVYEFCIHNMKTGKPVCSIVKVLAIVIKYFFETECTVRTKSLDLVDLSGENADHLFNALSSKLSDLGLDIKDVMGFAADTTNLMFGQHSSIVAKIKEVNPK